MCKKKCKQKICTAQFAQHNQHPPSRRPGCSRRLERSSECTILKIRMGSVSCLWRSFCKTLDLRKRSWGSKSNWSWLRKMVHRSKLTVWFLWSTNFQLGYALYSLMISQATMSSPLWYSLCTLSSITYCWRCWTLLLCNLSSLVGSRTPIPHGSKQTSGLPQEVDVSRCVSVSSILSEIVRQLFLQFSPSLLCIFL